MVTGNRFPTGAAGRGRRRGRWRADGRHCGRSSEWRRLRELGMRRMMAAAVSAGRESEVVDACLRLFNTWGLDWVGPLGRWGEGREIRLGLRILRSFVPPLAHAFMKGLGWPGCWVVLFRKGRSLVFGLAMPPRNLARRRWQGKLRTVAGDYRQALYVQY